ncbi:MAG TPA: hypothetical protein VE934_11735 [Polaromonas sp.]|uniref:hypothetical protein n=1 Tax=Polaromonas sp. TaxID=1869339 RepID=UPI002D6EB4F3|nr:hypothetical protein [Polaromonas sp.]HYW57626.1 hypothetical protein [Polaromonas sp.]
MSLVQVLGTLRHRLAERFFSVRVHVADCRGVLTRPVKVAYAAVLATLAPIVC